MQEAQGEAVKRLYKAVSHMAERLRDPKAVFKRSLVESVEELVTLLPGFNLTGDSELEGVVSMVRGSLTGLKVEELRESQSIRQGVAHDAAQIVNRMEGVWGKIG